MRIRFVEQNLERDFEKERYTSTSASTASSLFPKFKPNTIFVFEDGLRSYETDDNGNIFKINGKYLPNESFVLNGEPYVTDSEGNLSSLCERLSKYIDISDLD